MIPKAIAHFSLYMFMIMGIIPAFGQENSHFFYHLDRSNGLQDGTIKAFAQDKYGYMWIGTLSGLYRYNSCDISLYAPDINDSLSFPASNIISMFCDSKGNLWVGAGSGLYLFDYEKKKFYLANGTKNVYIYKIDQIDEQNILIYTKKGIGSFNLVSGKISYTYNHSKDLNLDISDGVFYKGILYCASDTGIICYNVSEKKTEKIIAASDRFKGASKLVIDKDGIIWALYTYEMILYKIDPKTEYIKAITDFQYAPNGLKGSISDIYIDRKDRLWLATVYQGIILYDKRTGTFESLEYNDRFPLAGTLHYVTNEIYEDNKGNIWIGTEGAGVHYFNPDAPSYKLLTPEFPNNKNGSVWCRTIVKDKEDNIWMGTSMGIMVQNTKTKKVQIFQNTHKNPEMLQNNSIRSMICDDRGNIWIGTANGVNMYDSKNKQMRFLSDEGSIPYSFYWTILQDNEKGIWFGSKDGLFYKEPNSKKIYSAKNISVLKDYSNYGVLSLFEDSKQNLWIGFAKNGVLHYDRKKNTVRLFKKEWGNKHNIIGNVVTSITEDKNGFIWFSTYTGISCYSYSSNSFESFDQSNGLEAVKSSCLLADNKNRLWIGTSNGIYVLGSDRRTLSPYGTNYGLPNVEFNDQLAYKIDKDNSVYPTHNGYLFFNPIEFVPDTNNLNFYISSINVLEKPVKLDRAVEDIQEIYLKSNEKNFNIELSAINYKNPDKSWYAYKLEGINNDWVYSQNRIVKYTNLPGGTYTFRYKASNDINNWKVPEKTIIIKVFTPIHKRLWFLFLSAGVITTIIVFFIRSRFKKQKQILELKSKAQLLEKEKTIVMYQNLKQQLNPHHLFNTLSSISSIMRFDPKLAGEYLENMSNIYRYILRSNDNNIVYIRGEITFIEDYIKLQHVRYNGGLNVEIYINENTMDSKIVAVTLQNLIDNAIKHNIIDDESPLKISIYNEPGYLVVKNNLQKKKNVETSNKQGLINLISLYKYLASQAIIIEETNNHFIIKIPLL